MLFVFVLMMKFTVWCMVASIKLTIMCARLMWPLLVFLTKMLMVAVTAGVALIGGSLDKRRQRERLETRATSGIGPAGIER